MDSLSDADVAAVNSSWSVETQTFAVPDHFGDVALTLH